MAWHHRLRNIFRSDRLSADIEREMAFHLAEREDDLVARGMAPATASAEARRRFGNRTGLAERTRETDLVAWLDSLARDVRHALRSLLAARGFTLVVVLSLALGIGANTAIFSLVDAVLLRSLPVRDPQTLVQLGENGTADVLTNPIWEQLRDRREIFAAAAYGTGDFNISLGSVARPVSGSWVSGDYFNVLGVRPAAGRLLGRADDVRGCAPIAVLGYGFWQSEYGGAASAIGSRISLSGHPFTIIGVAAPEFFGLDVGQSVQVYAPLCAFEITSGPGSLDRRSMWFLSVIARRLPGVSYEQTLARLRAAAPAIMEAAVPTNWRPEQQQQFRQRSFSLQPGSKGLSFLRTRYEKPLRVLMLVVGLVLLIACANVGNLMLARSATRQREMATRVALGAGRTRIARQLLTESVILALGGAALGVLFASWGSRLLVGFMSTRTNVVWLDLALNWRLLAFTVVVAIATAIGFGLAPAWRASRVDPQVALRSGGRTMRGDRSRTTTALVVSQVALSLVLVTAASLLLGSFRRLASIDTGFRAAGVVTVAPEAGSDFTDPAQRARAMRLLDRFRALPGVQSAAAVGIVPVSGMAWNDRVLVAGYTPKAEHDDIIWFNAVSDGWFATMRTALVAGRDFATSDRAGAPSVAIVSQSTARRFFGDADPIGRTLQREQHGTEPPKPPLTIVGVARDASYRSVRDTATTTIYVPFSQTEDAPPARYVLRTGTAIETIVPEIKRVVEAEAPGMSIRISSLASDVASTLRRERVLAVLSGFFGALGLLLATIGLYGTLAYRVTRRRSEIGIRLALGAARARVLRMVLGEAGRILAAGVVLGLSLAYAASKLVASLLYGIDAHDPLTFGAAAIAMALVGIAAASFPAWRAARLDPLETLREE